MLLDDEDEVPEAVKEDESKCFGFSCLEWLKSHFCRYVFYVIACFRFFFIYLMILDKSETDKKRKMQLYTNVISAASNRRSRNNWTPQCSS